VTKLSLLERASEEAREYRWLESQRVGRDLGDQAIEDWNRRFWLSFCRHRWVEHLEGRVYWKEFDEDHFGLLKRTRFRAPPKLVQNVIEKFRHVGENLDIIVWAIEEGHDVSAVIEVLARLDINSQRDTWMNL